MATPVSDFEIVTLRFHSFAKLPERCKELVEAYASKSWVDDLRNGELCVEIAAHRVAEIRAAASKPAYLMGRCCDGAERDKGRLVHAVPVMDNKALCGATYGRRSAGWQDTDKAVTCPRCLKRMEG